MEFDKPQVSASDIVEIMRSYPFGEVVECRRLEGGTMNTTFRVVTEERIVAVRIHNRGSRTLEHTEMELEILQHLRKLGFESLLVLAGADGRILQQWQQRYAVSVTEFIHGDTVGPGGLTPGLLTNMGRLTARFERAMESFKVGIIPADETVFARSDYVLQALALESQRRWWDMDTGTIGVQWERACRSLMTHYASLKSNFIHGDIAPNNIIIDGDRVVALLDFDEWCYGPTIFDVAIALMEFAMFKGVVMDDDLAVAYLAGYLGEGRTITSQEEEIILTAMEMTCVVWLADYVVQPPALDLENAKVHVRRLAMLDNGTTRREFLGQIRRLVETARAFHPRGASL